jgi:hypothetical protein
VLLHRASEEWFVLVATGSHQMRVNRPEVKARVLSGPRECILLCMCRSILDSKSTTAITAAHDLHLARNHFLPTSEETGTQIRQSLPLLLAVLQDSRKCKLALLFRDTSAFCARKYSPWRTILR